MDIDITDSTFSLNVPEINQVIVNSLDGTTPDYNMYIYFGAAILVIFIGILIFYNFTKFYQNKKNEQSGYDCPGGFCTMNEYPRDI